MPLVKRVGTELIREGLIVATRGGIVVDLANIDGPVRFGLPEEISDEEGKVKISFSFSDEIFNKKKFIEFIEGQSFFQFEIFFNYIVFLNNLILS